MKKRVFCAAVVLIMLISLMPTFSFAEGAGVPADGDFVYIGSNEGTPIKWRVLDADAMNTGEPGMFIFSEYLIQKFGTAYAEAVAGWQGSMAQQWCSDFYQSAFTAAEQAVIPKVSKDEEESQLFGLRWGETQLIDENVFFISSMELAQYVGDKDGAEGLSASTPDGEVGYWWLRTSHRNHPDYSGLVLEENQVHDFLVYIVWGTRPAMNLDLNKVLCFERAFEGADGEWKTVAVDESRSITVENVSLEGDKLKADYSGAGQGEGEYISLLVRDGEGKPIHSERVCQAQGSGTVEIPVAGLNVPEGGRVYLYAEKDNGDYQTSYASAPSELSCLLSFEAGEGEGEMESVSLTPGVPTALPDCGFTAQPHRRFDHWEKDGETLDESICLSGDTLITAVYSDIPVSSVSFEDKAVELKLFEKALITAEIQPEDAADKSLIWTSGENKTIAVDDNGDGSAWIKAQFPGTAEIKAYSADGGAEGSFTVTVTGSAYTAYAAHYGVYALAFSVLALAAMLLLSRIKHKNDRK